MTCPLFATVKEDGRALSAVIFLFLHLKQASYTRVYSARLMSSGPSASDQKVC